MEPQIVGETTSLKGGNIIATASRLDKDRAAYRLTISATSVTRKMFVASKEVWGIATVKEYTASLLRVLADHDFDDICFILAACNFHRNSAQSNQAPKAQGA